jgi:predicted enzyme related to lactoylglutathione lyase
MSQTSGSTTPLVGELNFVMLHVASVAEVRDFYVEKLGMNVLDENPGFVMLRGLGHGGASLGIGQGEPAAGATPIELWWQVEDADALHAALVERGVRIVQAPKDEPFGRSVAFSDPAGNVLYAYQPPR